MIEHIQAHTMLICTIDQYPGGWWDMPWKLKENDYKKIRHVRNWLLLFKRLIALSLFEFRLCEWRILRWTRSNLADRRFECYFTEVIPPNNFWWLLRSPLPCLHFPSKFEWSPLWILPNFLAISPFGFSITTDSPFFFSQKSSDPPLKSSPPPGDK